MAPVTLDSLPNELLLHIWNFLDAWSACPPSVRKFHEVPSLALTDADAASIKALSLVCHRWRALVLPYLFKYARLKLDGADRWLELSASLPPAIESSSRPLSSRRSGICGRSAHPGSTSRDHSFPRFNDASEVKQFAKDGAAFRSQPGTLSSWLPPSLSTAEFLRFVGDNKLERKIHSLVVYTDSVFPERPSELLANRMNEEHETFWRAVLHTLNPTRIVMAMPPSTMAALTDGKMHTDDAWAFAQEMHFLELRQSHSDIKDTPVFEDDTGTTFKYHRCLHNMRRWTHLAYNEGSFIPAYSTYEYFLKRPPMIIYYLLLWLQKEAKFAPPRLQSIAYTGIFPFGTHIAGIMDVVHLVDQAHSLRELELSFAPDPQSSILNDSVHLGKADLNDCWSEFDTAYLEVIKTVARPHQAPGLRIKCKDYRIEAVKDGLDRRFELLSELGWVKDGHTWVKPDATTREPEGLRAEN